MAYNLPWEGEMQDKPHLRDFAKPDVPTCSLKDRIAHVRQRIEQDGRSICVVVNDDNVVFGLLTSKELSENEAQTSEQVMKRAPVTFRPDTSLEEAKKFMNRHDQEYVLVTTPDGVLFGSIVCDEVRHALEESAKEEEHIHLLCR